MIELGGLVFVEGDGFVGGGLELESTLTLVVGDQFDPIVLEESDSTEEIQSSI